MVSIFGNITYIETKNDIFYVENDNLLLYHKNKNGNKKGYHKHNKNFNNINEIIKYCLKHKNKKSKEFNNFIKTEKLFSKI